MNFIFNGFIWKQTNLIFFVLFSNSNTKKKRRKENGNEKNNYLFCYLFMNLKPKNINKKKKIIPQFYAKIQKREMKKWAMGWTWFWYLVCLICVTQKLLKYVAFNKHASNSLTNSSVWKKACATWKDTCRDFHHSASDNTEVSVRFTASYSTSPGHLKSGIPPIDDVVYGLKNVLSMGNMKWQWIIQWRSQ